MPYINSTVTVKLSDEKKELIKAKLGEIICEIPGKSEQWLMVGFNDNYCLYFRGDKKEKAAFVEVKVMGETDRKYKEIITSKICDLFEKELSIPQNEIFITFHDINDWGWNGSMF